jgi:hypothetical protein
VKSVSVMHACGKGVEGELVGRIEQSGINPRGGAQGKLPPQLPPKTST